MLGGGKVIADALVFGTSRIGVVVGVGVEVGVVATFFVNRYPPAPTKIKNIIMIKINFHFFFGVETSIIGGRFG
ncbi:hypothetical protein A2130_00365 [Candidatus Woesebacteria bacterium GWC2_33_12]|nr:MAG: hypothetical protein A2130_00365 [Candidatus Woesebacteria bacterium GWC2_33_12]OGM79850.1 MAG: hypothetical protein A2366_03210 [Candidatus Woesebacteria bacterium RIFOXYB1_FULL_33_9]HCR35962.1 hypothetical protein [Candidatus Woesebacteria bacterium]